METETLVCGMYRSENAAKKSIAELTASGFEPSQVKTLIGKNKKNEQSHHDFVHAQPANVLHGALIGAVIGFFLFSFIGFFIQYFATSAVTVGSFADFPRNGQSGVPTLLISLLTGGLAGIFLGAASGALAGIGIPGSVSHRYRFYLKEGGLLIAVKSTSKQQQDKANQILSKMGAQDIAELQSTQVMNLANA